MDESFAISVIVGDREYEFQGRLATVGYTHKFYVVINGLEVTYEPDEERNYRAIIADTSHASVRATDLELIKAVGEKLQSVGE